MPSPDETASPGPTGTDSANGRDISFVAADGFALTGTLLEGEGDGPLVLISSATAAPRSYYAAFARALVAAGARAALTYDYRGTGGSPRPANFRKRINMKDWALLDLPAAAKALDEIAPGHPIVGLGQSYGGQALGLCGISGRFQRYGMVATMSGYFGGLNDRKAKWRMLGIGVPLSFLMENTTRRFGVGEPIPSTVLRDWARWCRLPNYFFDDDDFPETARYGNVRTPILAFGVTDDVWGTPRAINSLMKHYEIAPVEIRYVSPDDAGGPIGHLGFFRSRYATTLWPQLIDWLLTGKAVTLGEPG